MAFIMVSITCYGPFGCGSIGHHIKCIIDKSVTASCSWQSLPFSHKHVNKRFLNVKSYKNK